MRLKFLTRLSLEKTQVFENIYEEQLRLSLDEKRPIIDAGFSLWMLYDGELAGETYGIRPSDLNEDIEDVSPQEVSCVYCYSTTILPPFQNRGLGKLLKAAWIGSLLGKTPAIIGHATSPAAVQLNRFFGARFLERHRNWYGTEREAWYYKIVL